MASLHVTTMTLITMVIATTYLRCIILSGNQELLISMQDVTLVAQVQCYVNWSLKATARAKHGKGMCRLVFDSAPIPKLWQNFLRVDLFSRQISYAVICLC